MAQKGGFFQRLFYLYSKECFKSEGEGVGL